MADQKLTYVAQTPLLHDGEIYKEGDEIDLTEKSAARLLREKKIVPAEEKKKGGKK